MKKLISITFLVSISIISIAQSAKKYYKAGEDFIESKNYRDAIDLFTKAIDLEPDYTDAYIARATAYEASKKYAEAAQDYDRASTFMLKDPEINYQAARAYYQLGDYDNALKKSDQALEIKDNHLAAMQIKALSLLEQEKYYPALQVSTKSLEIKDNAFNSYIHGMISKKLKDLAGAERDFQKAISKSNNYTAAYIEIADVQRQLNKIAPATQNIDKALSLEPDNTQAYIVRSKIYKETLDYPKAINDISKALLTKPNDIELLLIRGEYYQEFNQQSFAINDYNQILNVDDKNVDALFNRGKSYEKVGNYKAAVSDYEKLATITEGEPKYTKLLEKTKLRLFELSRESDKPVVEFTTPKVVDNLVVEVAKDKVEVSISGVIKDASEITFLKINDANVELEKTELGYEFQTNVYLGSNNMLSIASSDAYNNLLSETYTIRRTEVEPPVVNILAPYASDNGEIFLSDNNSNLYIEGKISDESLISNITIDGVVASFSPEEFNPSFSASLNINNKNKFTVKAVDKYGNEILQEFTLNRTAAGLIEENPMGKTWVVFIENSNYSNFASLDGPAKDVTLMKSAFARYSVHNVIHKKDMSKREMERFFSIELRDLVRSNRVNSLLVWYAGHGKFINETGYWIPIDAKRDDEFTYFNINALKASLQSYSNYVTHTLVITDACESGPTFYQAMRSTGENRSCSDWQATRFKSSQVFSSAGYELAVDNSQFTRTFSNALNNNPNACISIEDVVKKVSDAVEGNNQQKPKFGKIDGLADENGTFFFIQKD